MMRGRFIELTSKDVEVMEAELRTLCARCGSEAVVLLDLSGAILASFRVPDKIDALLFASLLSSNFAATEELSHRLGVAEFRVMFHEGKRQNLYFEKVSEDAILVVLYTDPNAMGRVRLFCEKSVPAIAKLVSELAQRGAEAKAPEQGKRAAEYLAEVASSFQPVEGSG